jgi:hypothetical protein
LPSASDTDRVAEVDGRNVAGAICRIVLDPRGVLSIMVSPRQRPDWFVWKVSTLGAVAVLSFIWFGAAGAIVGSDSGRLIAGGMLAAGLLGANGFWRYFRRPIHEVDHGNE